ncbi:MAG: hypothetical protein H6Q00_2273 [Holophagaceae bacterium]|nr:hypothetical protein [Holophagaceae bacterium]
MIPLPTNANNEVDPMGHVADSPTQGFGLRRWAPIVLCLGLSLSIGCSGHGGGGGVFSNLEQRFSLSASPASLEIPSGGSGYLTVTATRSGGFTGAITLAVENLPTGVVASGSIPADASTGRLTIAVAEGVAAQNLGSLSLQGSSGTKKQTTSLALSILAPLPASSLPTGSTVASGSDQTGGSLQNHAVALEHVSITTAKNPQETVELRHGFLPTPQPSLP